MLDQIEAELRSVLVQCAEEVPEDACDRVRGTCYRPRLRSAKFRVAIGSVSAAVLATATSVVLLTVGPGIQNAFADWSPAPTPASTGQIATAEATCLQAIVATAQSGNSANSGSVFITTTSEWQAEVEDVRGPFTLVAYQASDGSAANSASCLTGGSSWSGGPQVMMSNGDGVSISSGAAGGTARAQGQGFSSISNSPPSVETIGDLSTDWNSLSNDDVAIGQAGSGVTGVTLALNDGTNVIATVANGYFAAWWPGNFAVSSADVSTAQGTATTAFPNP
jgi:hypothetical protein